MANEVNDEESPIKVIRHDVQINEFLCFVMCKSKVLTNVHLSKLCCDTCDEQTIRSAKDMLLKCVSLPDNDKRKKRRRTKVKATIMQDIMSIFYRMSSDDVSKFVTQDLNNLPPLTMDSFDMSILIHEMTSVKSQLQILQEAQETIFNAHAALCEKSQVVEKHPESPISSLPPNTPPDVDTPSIRIPSTDGTKSKQSITNNNINHGMDGDDDDALRLAILQGRAPPVVRHGHHQGSPPRNPPSPGDSIMSDTSYSSLFRRMHPSMSRDSASRRPGQSSVLKTIRMNRRTLNNNQIQQKKDIITGTGHSRNLRAASPKRMPYKYKECIGVFVSRLHSDTRVADIKMYIQNKIPELRVKVDPIPTRYDSYASYRVLASVRNRESLLMASFWPRGVLVKEYNKVIY